MIVFVTTALILSSETARNMLQNTFALASAVVADHYMLCFVGVVAVAALCMLTRSKHSMTDAPSLLVMNRCAGRWCCRCRVTWHAQAPGVGRVAGPTLCAHQTRNARSILTPRPLLALSFPRSDPLCSRIADTDTKAQIYTKLHATGGGSEEDRKEHCQDMVNQYYDMATDFYEFGWYVPRVHWCTV